MSRQWYTDNTENQLLNVSNQPNQTSTMQSKQKNISKITENGKQDEEKTKTQLSTKTDRIWELSISLQNHRII